MNLSDKIFPIRLNCVDYDTYVQSPELATKIWHRIRVKEYPKMTWYAASAVIYGPTSVVVAIYDIFDSYHGGVGQQILTIDNPDLDQGEIALINREVEKKKTELAVGEYEERMDEQRRQAILAVRRELFGE